MNATADEKCLQHELQLIIPTESCALLLSQTTTRQFPLNLSYVPANLRLRSVLDPHAHVVELPIEIVLPQIDAPVLGRVQDMRNSDAPQVLLLPQGGPVAQHNSGEDLVAIDALSDSLVLGEGRRKSWQRSDLEDAKMIGPVHISGLIWL